MSTNSFEALPLTKDDITVKIHTQQYTHSHRSISVGLVAICVGLTCLAACGSSPDLSVASTQEALIASPNFGSPGANAFLFGNNLAIDGTTVAVGDYTTNGVGPATVHMFTRGASGAYTFQQDITPAGNVEIGAQLGTLALKNGVLIASDIGGGFTYVFTQVTGVWTQQAKLQGGGKVAYNGTWLALAHGNAAVYQQGANPASWSALVNVSARGNTVAMTATRMVVGDGKNSGPGMYADIYDLNATTNVWGLTQSLTPLDTSGDFFGSAVGLVGNTVIVGYAHCYNKTVQTGCAVVFNLVNNVWTQTQVLFGGSTGDQSFFGQSLAVAGTRMIVGAYGGYVGSPTGHAYTFDSNNNGQFSQTQDLKPTNNQAQTMRFGQFVAIESTHQFAVIGAPFYDLNKGQVYPYNLQ